MTKLDKPVRRIFKGRMTGRKYVVEISAGDGKAPILTLREFHRRLTYRIDLEVLFLRLAKLRG